MKRSVIVRFAKEGFHVYPDAPSEVAFLQCLHRHMFHVEVEITTRHNDREIEFILFKRWCEGLWEVVMIKTDDRRSCEDIAEQYCKLIREKYPNRKVIVSVFEDNENGARIVFDL